MGPSIIETVVRSNGKTLSPQMLRSTGNHQPYIGPPASSGTSHLSNCKAEFPVQAAAERTNESGPSVEFPQHTTQAVPPATATCGCVGLGSTASPPFNMNSQDVNSHVSGDKSADGKKKTSCSPIKTTAPSLAGGSAAPAEKPPTAASVQLDYDDSAYKIGQVKIFDQTQKAIPKLYEARWQVILPDISDQVAARLRRGRFAMRLNKAEALPSIHLMSAGVTKELSIPAVVVVVPKHTKAMQQFLSTDSIVQTLCKPEDGTTVELLVFACKGQLTLIGMSSHILRDDMVSSSDSESDSLLDDSDSMTSSRDGDSSAGHFSMKRAPDIDAEYVSVCGEYKNINGNEKCGAAIWLVTKDGSRCVRGTCGGLLQLEAPNRSPRQVGLLAGHLLEQLKRTSNETSGETCETRPIIGDILYPKSSREIPGHDWALFSAPYFNYQGFTTGQPTLTIAQEAEFPESNATVIIRTSRGESTGTLLSTTSGIMLDLNRGFVPARMIIMAKGSTITTGDSGAWVLHDGHGKLYGYIIAANNTHAYMMPLYSAISEMKAKLGVVNVALTPSFHLSSYRYLAMTTEELFQTRKSIETSEAVSNLGYSGTPSDVDRIKALATTHPDQPRAAEAAPPWGKAWLGQDRLSQEDQSRLASQHELGKAHLERGRVLKAIEVLETVVEARGQLFGRNHVDCLASQHELAIAYIEGGQVSEAIRILEHVVVEEEKLFDESHIGRLTSQHELGRAYLAHGQVSEAIKTLKHVVAVKEKVFKESDLHLLASQLVLAEAHLRAGQVSDATKLLKHVVAVAEATFEEHDKFRVDSREWLEFALKTPM